MIFGLASIKSDLNKIHKSLEEAKQLVPPAEISDDFDSEDNALEKEDLQFLKRCYKILARLGYIKSQYQFSEQFLNKNRYYFGMLLCEQRHPSIDAVHNLVRNISQINDGLNKLRYLDDLYKQGQDLITKRLLKYL